jgi:hypothetical protein
MSNTQLPAHLLDLFNSNPDLAKVAENVRSEGAHAKVKFNGKRWRLVSATGEETAVPAFWLTDASGQLVNPPVAINGLDVIIVDVNEHKSHTVYDKEYNEDEQTAPVWSSDDGTPVPAEHEGKVVSDYRRIAVLWANNPEMGLFELRLASKSLTPFAKYSTALKSNGVPVPFVVTRITFDDAYDYPVLSFAPNRYINEAEKATLLKASTTHRDQVQALIGLGNKTALASPAVQAALPAPAAVAAPAVPVEKKTRARKVEAPVAAPAVVMPMTAPVPTTAAAAVVTKPQPASSDIDALLNNIMGNGR